MSNSRFRSAFTLIELLVVIAIIAILAAILFPVFAQAKQAAKGASSLSNIKQTTLASLMYNGDYDDVFVTPGLIAAPNYGWKNTWLVLIQPYMKNVDIFKCPGDTYSQAPTEAWDVDATGKKNPRFTYIANGVVGGSCGAPNWTWNLIGVINAGRDWFSSPSSANGTAIGLPAETIMFATRYRLHPSVTNRYDSAFSQWMTTMVGADGFDQRSMPGSPNGTWGALDGSYDGTIGTAFAGKSPFGFVDGHAKTLKPSSTIKVDGTVPNNGCQDSPFFKYWSGIRTQ
jgi:prepilin-type N-terminal cleavage/methylation domain-containing protein